MPKALAAAARLAADRDPERVLLDLEGLCRDVLICAALGNIPAWLQTTPARDQLIVATANALKGVGVARLLDEIAAALLAVRAGADPRVRLELTPVKTADPSLSPPSSEQTARRLDRSKPLCSPATAPGAHRAVAADERPFRCSARRPRRSSARSRLRFREVELAHIHMP